MNAHEHWMRQALMLAQRAGDSGEVPVGAVVILDGQVIGEGWNQPISLKDPTAHAEVAAIRAAAQTVGNYRLPGAQLYVTIEPCTMCTGALMHARIEHLIYAAREPKAGVIESQMQLTREPYWNHSLQVTGGVLAEESRALIQGFFQSRRAAR